MGPDFVQEAFAAEGYCEHARPGDYTRGVARAARGLHPSPLESTPYRNPREWGQSEFFVYLRAGMPPDSQGRTSTRGRGSRRRQGRAHRDLRRGIALCDAKLPVIRQAELHVESGLGFPIFSSPGCRSSGSGGSVRFLDFDPETLVGTAHRPEHQASDAYALVCAEIAFNVHVQLSDLLGTA